MAAGLALATKGTAYPIGIPLGIWFLVELLAARRRVLGSLLVCTFLVLLPNLTFYQRNLDYSGSPIGTLGQWTNNASFGLGPLVVNGARNLAVNLASADRALNRRITEVVYTGLTALGLDTNSPACPFHPRPIFFNSWPIRPTSLPPGIRCSWSLVSSPFWSCSSAPARNLTRDEAMPSASLSRR